MAGPSSPGVSGWSCSTTYAVMIFVMLAIGTGCCGPELAV